MTTNASTVPRYSLTCPTEDDALASLQRVLGERRAVEIWQAARRALGIGPEHDPLDLAQLHRIAEQLALHDGLAGVMGTALSIRIRTYECLSDLDAERSSRRGFLP